MAEVMMFDENNDQIKSSKFKGYQGVDGQTDTVGIVYTDPKKKFCGVATHFHERYYVCRSTKDQKAICCTASYKGNKPSYRVGAVIVKYKFDETGEKKKLTGFEVLPWVFSATVYNNLKKLNKEWPLDSHDVKVSCEVKKGMKTYDFTPCKNSIWQSNENLKNKVIDKFDQCMEDAKNNLASDLSIEEIKEIIGIDDQGAEDAAVNVNMDDVVGEI